MPRSYTRGHGTDRRIFRLLLNGLKLVDVRLAFKSEGEVVPPRGGRIRTSLLGRADTRVLEVGHDRYVAGGRAIAFKRDRHGDYESLDVPELASATVAQAFGITPAGDIVGQDVVGGVTRGFVLYRTPAP